MGGHSLTTLYLHCWKGTDWRSKWIMRWTDTSHITLQAVTRKQNRLDGPFRTVSDKTLHVDARKAAWLDTKPLLRAYKGKLSLVRSARIGQRVEFNPTLPDPQSQFSTWQYVLWGYGGKLVAPRWRPDGCVKEVRRALAYYGVDCPDTALPNVLIDGVTSCT